MSGTNDRHVSKENLTDKFPATSHPLHEQDRKRGQRLRKFRMGLTSPRNAANQMTMGDMALLLSEKGYECTKERYRSWELGYNIPGRVCIILYDMGCNLNWLFTGKKNMMNLTKIK